MVKATYWISSATKFVDKDSPLINFPDISTPVSVSAFISFKIISAAALKKIIKAIVFWFNKVGEVYYNSNFILFLKPWF